MSRFTRQLVAALLGCWAGLLVPQAVLGAEPDQPDKLNVLLLVVDDLGNVLGRTKPAGLQTPNLDRLAQRGVFFERAYCQIPLCNPSRASLLTGLRPDTTGVFDLDRHFRDSVPEVVTLPQRFRQQGWFTARVGKIYHYDVPRAIGTDGLDDKPSWDLVVNPRGRDVDDEDQIINPTPQRPISAAMSWLAADGKDEEQTDGMIASEAIRLLERNRERPFFLGVGFFRPHTPYVAPRSYFDQYPLEDVRLHSVPEGDRDDIPTAAIPHNIPEPDYGLSQDDLRRALRAYYASVTFVDAQVGRVLDALERLGLAERTVIAFCSDHGYHLGEHGLWQKRTLFDESARAPVIIAWPGGKGRGVACQRVVEFVDVYPTLIDLAGLPPGNELAGRSLRPLLDDPGREWTHPGFTQILRPGADRPIMGRAVTTQRYRYIEWDEGRAGRELYDHATDPREETNLAADPRHRPTRDRLHELLRDRVRGTVPTIPFNPARL